MKPAAGILQDAGEVTVISSNKEQTRHRYALVIGFESQEQMQQVLQSTRCNFKPGKSLEPEICAVINHG